MSLLTTAQLTFCDLKDSYSVYLSSDCIGLACDNSGLVLGTQTVTINYHGLMGITRVGLSCEVLDLPDDIDVSITSSTESKDGTIVLKVKNGATLGNEPTASVKVVFITTDLNGFTFEKYITFVKYMNGANGTDAVDFQIYSVDGFEFSDNLSSIELKTIAFEGGSKIDTNNVTYQWKWWNINSSSDDKYESISGATSSTLIVNNSDIYALASIKCEMTYGGIVYEDYISLTKKTAIYTAIAKFFNGNNIITADDDYLIIYVELYKDNKPEELLYADSTYRSDANSVQNNIISTDLDGEYVNGDMMYFICKNTKENTVEYNVVLGRYNSDQWQVVSSNYIYKNDLFASSSSPVVFIPKEKIPKSLNINIEVYKNNSVVARTSAMVLDLNDPTISSSAPENPKNGQLWLDTSVSPSILKMWDGNEWVKSGYQNGNVIYTSRPTEGYSEGDLWILADGESCGDFGPGSMLRATTSSNTFVESHWKDAMEENTSVINNIKQYFIFNADTGLKIGQADDKFYVNISSTEMGFYDNSDSANPDQKVVSIGNKSATIKNVVVKESAQFDGSTTFNNQIKLQGTAASGTTVGFVWKVESNGSLSLSIAT